MAVGYMMFMMMLVVVAVAGLVVGSIALSMNPTVKNLTYESPKLVQPLLVGATGSLAPTVALALASTAFANPVVVSGSNNSAGTISGELLGAVAGTLAEFVVTFSTSYSQAPKVVIVTPANAYMAPQSVWVGSVTTTGFHFFLSKVDTQASPAGVSMVQFNYLVL